MLNKAILMGRLVADPELRRTQQGTAVTSFTLAVNRSFARNGEQPQTDFIDIVAWQSTAEFVSKWFKKGMQVAVSGRIQTRTWEDRQNQKRKSVEVVAEEVHFAESKRDFESRGGSNSTANDPFNMPARDSNDFSVASDNDDDLPF